MMSPFFLALAMTSAADLLITLVTYNGQFACLAMVMARYTASVSTYNTASVTHTRRHLLDVCFFTAVLQVGVVRVYLVCTSSG